MRPLPALTLVLMAIFFMGFSVGSVAADEIAAAGLDAGLDLHGELLRAAAEIATAGFDAGLDDVLLHGFSVGSVAADEITAARLHLRLDANLHGTLSFRIPAWVRKPASAMAL